MPNATTKPELFFGLIAPVGSDLSGIIEELKRSLVDVGYQTETVHLIELIHELERWKDLPETPLDDRINKHMDAGNELRRETKRGDAIAMLGVGNIQKLRSLRSGKREEPAPNIAYILRSLKHPSEVETLRRIYQAGFFGIAAYSPRNRRVEHLASSIAESHHRFQSGEFRAGAEALSQRDEAEADRFGQDVRDTFPLADLFVDTSDPPGASRSIKRFIELLFEHPFHTPTKDESAMFHSQAAALRSSSLGRQVGAVITTMEGNIIAVGTNEVPKAAGGFYWCDDTPDHRDFTLGYDTNDKIKVNIITEIIQYLSEAGWLTEDKRRTDIQQLVSLAVRGDERVIPRTAQVMNVTEFGRSVHAEMAAITDAARRGIPLAGATLYTTTFPCHNCTKHIVAAGISRVVYVEPYPKSLAVDLHLDAIEVDAPAGGASVNFKPFVGISPRRYIDLFTAGKSKTDEGRVITWNASSSTPRFASMYPLYVVNETKMLSEFYKMLDERQLQAVRSKRGEE